MRGSSVEPPPGSQVRNAVSTFFDMDTLVIRPCPLGMCPYAQLSLRNRPRPLYVAGRARRSQTAKHAPATATAGVVHGSSETTVEAVPGISDTLPIIAYRKYANPAKLKAGKTAHRMNRVSRSRRAAKKRMTASAVNA